MFIHFYYVHILHRDAFMMHAYIQMLYKIDTKGDAYA